MSAGKYHIVTEEFGDVFVGSHDSTKEEALNNFLVNHDIKKKDINSCRLSAAHKARCVYINAIRKAGHDLDRAAVLADQKGYNRACDFQSEWIEAIDIA